LGVRANIVGPTLEATGYMSVDDFMLFGTVLVKDWNIKIGTHDKGYCEFLQECEDRVREGPTVTSWRNIRTRTSDADHPDALASPGRHCCRAGPSTPAHAG
jgi:hypothetical protein